MGFTTLVTAKPKHYLVETKGDVDNYPAPILEVIDPSTIPLIDDGWVKKVQYEYPGSVDDLVDAKDSSDYIYVDQGDRGQEEIIANGKTNKKSVILFLYQRDI